VTFYIWSRLSMKINVKNRSNHNMAHMGPYLNSFLPYAQKRMGFNRPPTIFFDSDPENADNVLGKTGHYNPDTEEIVIYVDKRHPKDILRSLSHELVHHTQNCRGDLNPEIAGETTPGYAQSNTHMREMESEAYKFGNGLYFRDWEDSLKNQVEETNYKHITGDSHKMATYEQLKEEITKKVVAALTEKLNEGEKKPDGDGDGVPPWADKDDNDPKVQEEAVEEVNEEEEIEERKKRDTPRDSDRREDVKLKVNEQEDPKPEDDPEVEPRGKEEELQERWSDDVPPEIEFGDAASSRAPRMTQDERDRLRRQNFLAAMAKAEEREKAAAQKEETVEEATSNDEWYQNELFESLKKRWTK
jgi:hypothetical protein